MGGHADLFRSVIAAAALWGFITTLMMGMAKFHYAIPLLASSCGQGMVFRVEQEGIMASEDGYSGIISDRLLSNGTKHSPSVARARTMAEDVWCLGTISRTWIHRGLNAAAPIWSGKMLHDNLTPRVCRSLTPSLPFSHLPSQWTTTSTTLLTIPPPSARSPANARPMAMTPPPRTVSPQNP
jgi:hypothetical protein